MISVRPLDPGEAGRRQTALIRLLRDAVEGGASNGFVLPLERPQVRAC